MPPQAGDGWALRGVRRPAAGHWGAADLGEQGGRLRSTAWRCEMTAERRLKMEGFFRKLFDTTDEMWRTYLEDENEEIRADTLSNSLANPFAHNNPLQALLIRMGGFVKDVDERKALYSLVGAARVQQMISERSKDLILAELDSTCPTK